MLQSGFRSVSQEFFLGVERSPNVQVVVVNMAPSMIMKSNQKLGQKVSEHFNAPTLTNTTAEAADGN